MNPWPGDGGRMRPRRMVVCFLLAAVASTAAAQEKPEPPRRDVSVARDSAARSTERLPKIDLPEYDITGDEVMDLPSFSKQAAEGGTALDPLAGRNGGSREHLGDAGIGKAADREAAAAGLRGKAAASYGSYVTPALQASFGQRFDAFDVLLKGAYRSSEGHAPNRDFREASASVGVGVDLDRDDAAGGVHRLDGTLGLEGDGYRLFGSAVPDRTRTVERFFLEGSLTGASDLLTSFEAGVRIGTAGVTDTLVARETEVGLTAAGEAELGAFTLDADAAFWVDFYRAPTTGSNPILLTLRPVARTMLTADLEGYAGFGFHLVRGSDTPALGRFWPEAGLSWYASERVTVFGAFEPTVERMNLGSLVRLHPYLVNNAVLRHTEFPVVVRAGVEYVPSRSWTVTAAAFYKEARGLPLPLDPSGAQLWTIAYDGTTRITGFEAEVYGALTADDQLGAAAEVRALHNSSTDGIPPYYPPYTVSVSYTRRFPFGLSAGTRFQGVGSQQVDAANTETLPAYLLWSLEAEYRLLPPLALTFGLTNILNARAERFKGYETRPRAVSFGLAYTW